MTSQRSHNLWWWLIGSSSGRQVVPCRSGRVVWTGGVCGTCVASPSSCRRRDAGNSWWEIAWRWYPRGWYNRRWYPRGWYNRRRYPRCWYTRRRNPRGWYTRRWYPRGWYTGRRYPRGWYAKWEHSRWGHSGRNCPRERYPRGCYSR